jgi:hypothetical protein
VTRVTLDTVVPAVGPPVILPPKSRPPIKERRLETSFWSGVYEPPPPPPPKDPQQDVKEGSFQRPSEDWWAFSDRMRLGYERHLWNEEPATKMSRLAREADAQRFRLSQKSTVYEWEPHEEDESFYIRTRVVKASAASTFELYPSYQVHY